MIIQHNMASANTNRQLGITTGQLSKSTEKLSSGYRINRAGDDAAGLSISEKMRGQIRGLDQASTNAQDGISLVQTAEGALNETQSILQRMRELTVQASNGTNVTADRVAIAEEVRALTSEVDRIANQTEFNTMKLLSGGLTDKQLQVGANTNQTITFSISAMTVNNLSISNLAVAAIISNGDSSAITKVISTVNDAITKVSTQRSKLGALQNRLEHTIANADNTAENLQAAESRIRDVDMAQEMVQYSKNNILQQAAQSMLAQANQSTQGVLSLLR
ncbi:flagellin N-terminal helical domain-containing protein [Anaerocolumna sp. MB42-C2]|uniref:flagellin N-terminal helical domain-containing protein n=1 Tax=Anaerocolumna sp. MB42-C2 TaxID=3070997 RepID=UPI0027E12FF7|nr:flagellin [Anaerocolumna sp. MB42-C2]WMJ90228.1 flagellin [Anaerocolumna sp. MB42-C2]